MTRPRVSVLVPVSESGPLGLPLLLEIEKALEPLGVPIEILVAFDGHRGREAAHLREEAAGRGSIRIIELHQRMGESAVLARAIRDASGEILLRVPPYRQVAWDALPRIVREIESGVDCALVERTNAKGKPAGGWHRKLHNRVLSRTARAEVRDASCLVCGFTSEVASALPVHGNLHRYLAVIVAVEGFSTAHLLAAESSEATGDKSPSPRSYLARLLDLVAVLFLARSTGSPLRFFGLLGLVPLAAGTILTLWLVWERLFQGQALAGRPLLLLGLLLVTAGIQSLAIGFLGELMVYLHYRDRYPDRVRPIASRSEDRTTARRDR